MTSRKRQWNHESRKRRTKEEIATGDIILNEKLNMAVAQARILFQRNLDAVHLMMEETTFHQIDLSMFIWKTPPIRCLTKQKKPHIHIVAFRKPGHSLRTWQDNFRKMIQLRKLGGRNYQMHWKRTWNQLVKALIYVYSFGRQCCEGGHREIDGHGTVSSEPLPFYTQAAQRQYVRNSYDEWTRNHDLKLITECKWCNGTNPGSCAYNLGHAQLLVTLNVLDSFQMDFDVNQWTYNNLGLSFKTCNFRTVFDDIK